MKKRYTEEQIIGFLREADAGMPVKELCRKHGPAGGRYGTPTVATSGRYSPYEKSEAVLDEQVRPTESTSTGEPIA